VERYAVIRERGQVWDTSREMREQERWDEHAAFMEALVDEGLIVLGGPLGDGAQVLHVFEARSEKEIAERLVADPWEQMGLLTTVSIRRWEILLRRTAYVSSR
jgi:uncharacterized protein YciI